MTIFGTRILFMAEAVTLAHVARPYGLARTLLASGYDVYLACDPRYRDLLGDDVPFLPLHSISNENFLAALARGKPVYDFAILHRYLDEDLRLLRQMRPALVVGDFRLSLAVSAPLTRTPYATITNAYWSPYARPRYVVPEVPLVKAVGVTIAQWVFDRLRRRIFARHAYPLNLLRRSCGLTPLGENLCMTYTYADYVCYADLAQMVPTVGLPDNHYYLGPVLWSPRCPLPPWWEKLTVGAPVIYVTMGSSGEVDVLTTIVDALATLSVTVIIASGGRAHLAHLPRNVYVADYLPGDKAAARAAVVICNGGSPATYQALAAGTPVLGISSNLDQHLNMQYMMGSGAGLGLRAGHVTRHRITTTVQRLLEEPIFRERAQALARTIAAQGAGNHFLTLVRQWIT